MCLTSDAALREQQATAEHDAIKFQRLLIVNVPKNFEGSLQLTSSLRVEKPIAGCLNLGYCFIRLEFIPELDYPPLLPYCLR